MASLGMGMNGGVMGVSMGFLDFTPEPPAPTATPVTEHVDLNIAHSQDTRDLSSATPNGEVRVKFETLKSLDPAETLDIENHLSPHHQLSSHPMHIVHHPSIPQSTVLAATQHLIAVQQQNQAQDGRPHSAHSSPSQPHTPHPPAVSTPNSNDDSNHSAADVKPIIHHQIITTPTSQAQGMGGSQDIYNSDNSTSEDVKMETSYNDGSNKNGNGTNSAGSKVWTPEDMDAALEALKTHQMSLTKASATYGIPSTTLWQRAHRLGIDTPKKEGPTKTWNEESLNSALEALRTGTISANKASKAYGIPSSTLYKIARREGIRLAAPFNAAPTNWSAEDLERALEAIRAGQTSVQKASTEFGIPTGTLYGRCKREGIELSRSNPTPWSEDAMMEALEAVRVGHMSINQAAIHYNLPYSSLYGRFKRGRYDNGGNDGSHTEHSPDNTMQYTPPPPQMHHQQQPQHQVVTSPPPNQHLHHLQPLPHYQPTHHQQATHHQQLPSSSQVQTLNNHHTIIYHETS